MSVLGWLVGFVIIAYFHLLKVLEDFKQPVEDVEAACIKFVADLHRYSISATEDTADEWCE